MQVFEAVSELIHRDWPRNGPGDAPSAGPAEGPPVVFGVCGSSNVAWVGRGLQNGLLQYIRTRHEETGVTAAAAYARVTGRVGLATATLGPGFANTLNSLRAVTHDHVPVILIVGESPGGRDMGFQEIEQREITKLIGAGYHTVLKPDELEPAWRAALTAALWNGMPQVLSVSQRILGEQITLGDAPAPVTRTLEAPDPESVSAAVDALAKAQAPLVIAGHGALLSGCHDDVVELAELVGARVANTLNANRFFSGHPYDLGVCGKSSPPVIVEELYRTDVVLGVGASLNPYTTGSGTLFPSATVIQCEVDADADFKASTPELGLLGDAGESVRALIAEWKRRGLGRRPQPHPVPPLHEVQASILKVDLGHDPTRGLDLRRVFAAFDEMLPADRVVLMDSGNAVLSYMSTLVDARDARSWLTSQGYGSIGLGLGAAIGAAVAVRGTGRQVALFVGDGGFTMGAQELDAIRINGLDVTIIVLNDEQYGSEVKYLREFGLDYGVIRQSMADTELLARAYGGTGVVVRTDDEMMALDVSSHPGLFVVETKLDQQVDGRSI